MVLNLDTSFNPYPDKSSIEFELFTFSGGEPQIRILDDIQNSEEVTITHRIRSFNAMGELLIAENALRNMNIKEIHLLMPYFPAARQDRLMVSGEALSVKVYAQLINNMNFDSVSIYDPHSEVAPALINNCQVIDNHKFIEKIIKNISKDTILVSPDGGALKKIYKLASYLQTYDVLECSKSRDVRTGKLSGFKVYADDLKGRDCLIVDDICDGGGTFIGLAKELKSKNAGRLFLAVSHGIFSKGIAELSNEFEVIFTTDSFNNIDMTEQVKQLKLQNGLLS